MKTTAFLALTFFTLAAHAQSFSGKTNDIPLNYTENPTITVSNLPAIQWYFPAVESTFSQKNTFEIEFGVASEAAIQRVKITVSNKTGGSGSTTLKAEEMIVRKIKKEIYLQNGPNEIEIVVTNAEGGTVSSTRIVTVGMDAIADAIDIDRKDYALVFATDKYENWDDLINPINDAHTIAKELTDRYKFSVDLVENPNQEDVWEKIVDYSQKKYRPQDQLVIFFAGHGFYDETLNEGYIVAHNSLQNDKGRSSYVSYERLRSLLNNIPCEHVLLIMDVCFGGTFDPAISRERGKMNTVDLMFLAKKLSHKTRKFLTSGGKEYVPDGRVGFNSPFATKVIMALRTGGGEDYILTLDEIKAYVEKLTPEPRFGSFGDDVAGSDFVFVSQHN